MNRLVATTQGWTLILPGEEKTQDDFRGGFRHAHFFGRVHDSRVCVLCVDQVSCDVVVAVAVDSLRGTLASQDPLHCLRSRGSCFAQALGHHLIQVKTFDGIATADLCDFSVCNLFGDLLLRGACVEQVTRHKLVLVSV